MQRYMLDLSTVFADHRQKVFVGRQQTWKTVSCMLNHVRSVFQISTDVFLTNGDGILFPEMEDIDVILSTDQLRLHCSNSLMVSTPKSNALKKAESAEARGDQRAKRKRESLNESVDLNGASDTEADDVLPKIFVEIDNVTKQDDDIEELTQPKRKRVRKRKQKKTEIEQPPKVVVKSYGKAKIPPIDIENGKSTSHIRFSEEANNEEVIQPKEEPYMNLDRNTVPRVIKAVSQVPEPNLNGEAPDIPEYDDALVELDDIVNGKGRGRNRKPKKSVEIKKELIDNNTQRRSATPTWDVEINSDKKEQFVSHYCGQEFWNSLREILENFPPISIPSVNDIIAYRVEGESYLAFVERADDGESDESPALKLTLRRLNGSSPETIVATLDKLTEIRLVATYQQ